MRRPPLSRLVWLFALAAATVTAQVDGTPVNLAPGGTFDLCTSGTIMCPAVAPRCDDLTVATVRDGPNGLQWVGVGPGTTLCSAQSTNKLRAVYRVTVSARPQATRDAGTR